MGIMNPPPPDKAFPRRHEPDLQEALAICRATDKNYTKGVTEGMWESRDEADILCAAPLYAVPKKLDPVGRIIWDGSQHGHGYFGVNRYIPNEWTPVILPSVRALRNRIARPGIKWLASRRAANLVRGIHRDLGC